MAAQPAEKRATLSSRVSDRLNGRRASARRSGRAPSAPGGPPAEPHRLAASARVLAAVLLPFGVALVQTEYYPHFTWALFYPAAYFSSRLGGTGAGLAATAVSAFLGLFFFTPPEESWPRHGYYAFVPAGLFVLMGAIFSVSHGRLKKVTLAWQAATKELDEVFENAPVGIFIADLSGRYTDVNEEACLLLGRAREELLGLRIGDLLRPGQESRLAADREYFLRTGAKRVGEWDLKRGDGSFVPVEVSACVLPDGRWQAFVRDLTERKRAEEAQRRLAEAQRHDELRLALESAANAMVMVDSRGRIAASNAEADRLFGYGPGELRGRFVEDLVPERYRASHPALRDAFLHEAGGRRSMAVGRPLVGLRKDGREFPVEIVLTRVDLDGEKFVITSAVDLTDRIAVEQRLRESEERLRLLVQNVKDYAIYMHDPDGNVTVWNEGAERLFGYRAEDILGRNIATFYTPEDAAAGKNESDLKAAVERGSLQVEAWRVRKDGSRFLANVVTTPVYGRDGTLVGYGKVLRDLTEVKRAEEDLRRTVQDLEGFAYTVSHDLRSPLRAIQGYAHFAQERLKDKADPQSLDMLQRISASAVRLDRLIRDVLSYSAITRQPLELGPVDLDKVVDHVVGLYPILQSARLNVARPLGAVLAQESLMLQVVSNLLVNAVKFVPAGRAAAIEVRTERSAPGKMSLIVADNGPGIPRVHWERIFQPFARLPSARGVAGSGIGLAIVKRAVERLGGTIRVESDPCTGTRFTIELTEAGHER
ncbi:MAG: PAS domain S-box protein [Elusimicrobia bacterium]|nr:PAS domain S-box protein [Elusimicrobiota bacterium]